MGLTPLPSNGRNTGRNGIGSRAELLSSLDHRSGSGPNYFQAQPASDDSSRSTALTIVVTAITPRIRVTGLRWSPVRDPLR
jgi:hypothetical protein